MHRPNTQGALALGSMGGRITLCLPVTMQETSGAVGSSLLRSGNICPSADSQPATSGTSASGSSTSWGVMLSNEPWTYSSGISSRVTAVTGHRVSSATCTISPS